MCLIGLSWQRHPRYALIVAANRDEFHARATDALAWWPGRTVLAGRDRVGGGTWLGVTRDGRFAALTNFREPVSPDAHADKPSRGALVTACLTTSPHGRLPADDLKNIDQFAGFNLISGRIGGATPALHYVTNRGDSVDTLAPAVYGLSNGVLNDPWPKVEDIASSLRGTNESTTSAYDFAEQLFGALARREPARDQALPNTGVGLDIERRLSASFIQGERYGTRCSTVLLVDHSGLAFMAERSFAPDGSTTMTRHFAWQLG